MNKENSALKLVDGIILYYDARSKKIYIYIYKTHECLKLKIIGRNVYGYNILMIKI